MASGNGPRAGQAPSEAELGSRVLGPASLRRLFLDLLGRPPFGVERQRWLGKQRGDLIDALLPTTEFWRNWLEEQLYYLLLVDSFRPTAGNVPALPESLSQRNLGVIQALQRICLSSSFDRRNPGPDTFVTVVMEQVLGLNVQKDARQLEIGKKVYDGTRGVFLGQPGKSQADIVNIAIEDERAIRFLLRREHERLLRHAPSEPSLREWSAALEEDPLCFGSILRTWLLSESYDRRLETSSPQPNRLFVRALFVDLLERLPEENEAQRMRGALDGLADSGPLRSLVARLILDSGKAAIPERAAIDDPAGWISGLFQRLLGRLPTTAEADAFLEAFQDPACRPATVLYAIVSHPEYQTW